MNLLCAAIFLVAICFKHPMGVVYGWPDQAEFWREVMYYKWYWMTASIFTVVIVDAFLFEVLG